MLRLLELLDLRALSFTELDHIGDREKQGMVDFVDPLSKLFNLQSKFKASPDVNNQVVTGTVGRSDWRSRILLPLPKSVRNLA